MVIPYRHDPHGGAYVLVAYSSGSVVLWDVAAHSCMATFERCAVGLVGVRWMAWAPGNFLALRYFNASVRQCGEPISCRKCLVPTHLLTFNDIDK